MKVKKYLSFYVFLFSFLWIFSRSNIFSLKKIESSQEILDLLNKKKFFEKNLFGKNIFLLQEKRIKKELHVSFPNYTFNVIKSYPNTLSIQKKSKELCSIKNSKLSNNIFQSLNEQSAQELCLSLKVFESAQSIRLHQNTFLNIKKDATEISFPLVQHKEVSQWWFHQLIKKTNKMPSQLKFFDQGRILATRVN